MQGFFNKDFGKMLTGALQSFLSNVMSLQYTEKPDYSLLKAGLLTSLQKMGGSLGEPLIFNLSKYTDLFTHLKV